MPSPPYIYNDLRASRARVRNLLPNLPGALIRPPGDRRPDLIAHGAEARPGGRQAQPRFINSPGLRPIGALAPRYWPLLAPLGPRRLQFVTLSPAPLVKVRAPAFSICHASAGPLWSGPVAGPLRAPAFPIRRGCVDDFLNFLIGSLGAPAFSICHAFAGPLGQG